MGMVKRGDVYLTILDPTVGSEQQKTRPCIVVSPNAMNEMLNTVIIAPLTSKTKDYPTRVTTNYENRTAQIVLEQIRVVDKSRFKQKMPAIESRAIEQACLILQTMFHL